MMTTETFGQMLQRLRADRTITAVANLAGVPRSNLSCMERGLRYPNASTLRQLAMHLGFSFDIAAAMVANEQAAKDETAESAD